MTTKLYDLLCVERKKFSTYDDFIGNVYNTVPFIDGKYIDEIVERSQLGVIYTLYKNKILEAENIEDMKHIASMFGILGLESKRNYKISLVIYLI